MTRMTGKQFEDDRLTLGWPRSELARRLKCDEATIRMMEQEKRVIPREIAAWLAPIAAVVRALPPPGPEEWMIRGPRLSRRRPQIDA